MTDLWLRRVSNVLHADGEESMFELVKLPFSTSLHAVIHRPRNLKHHRLYWMLVHRIANGVGADPENISDLLKLSTGHHSTIRSKTYGELKLPRSISFAAMGQGEFSQFFERCVGVIYEEWGIEPSAIADLLLPPGMSDLEPH